MKTALIVSGVLGALVLVFPSLVVIGMILLVIPGLVLMAMPTLFLYLLATWLIRLALPVDSDLVAYPIAAAGAVALASLAVWPLRSSAEREFAAAIQPEITPEAPITASGHILIEKRDEFDFSMGPSCGPLCLALLDLDAVESVTMIRDEIAVTFALEDVDPEDQPPSESLEPYDPSQIIEIADQSRDYQIVQAVRDALASDWAARLSGPQRLVAIERPEGPSDWHFIDSWKKNEQLREIRNRNGEPVLRYQTVGGDLPALPPYLKFTAGSAGLGFSGAKFGVGGSALLRESAAPSVHPDEIFARAVVLKDYWAAYAPDSSDQSE